MWMSKYCGYFWLVGLASCLATGCIDVRLTTVFGEPVAQQQLTSAQGIWKFEGGAAGDTDVVLVRATAQGLRIGLVNWQRPKPGEAESFGLEEQVCQLRKVHDRLLLFARNPQDDGTSPVWHVLRIDIQDQDHFQLYFPEKQAIQQWIDSDPRLSGQLLSESVKPAAMAVAGDADALLESLSAELLDRCFPESLTIKASRLAAIQPTR